MAPQATKHRSLHTTTPTARPGTTSQSNIDVLHTTTPSARSRPSVSQGIDAFNTATPSATSSTMHIYRSQMDTPVNPP